MDTFHYLTTEQRQATAAALKMATAKHNNNRPVLQTLQVKDGRAFATDSYTLVVLPWLDGLADGCYDGHALLAALKGAGREGARIAAMSYGLTVDRYDLGYLRDPSDLPEELGAFSRGTFVVPALDGATAVSAGTIFDDAVAAVEADDYVPELAPVDAARLAAVLKMTPSAYDKGRAMPVTVKPQGLKPAVIVNGQPYAVLMPMRVQ